MEWQLGTALICVLAATIYIARATWRTWHPKPGSCGGGCCGKSVEPPAADGTFIPSGELSILRRQR